MDETIDAEELDRSLQQLGPEPMAARRRNDEATADDDEAMAPNDEEAMETVQMEVAAHAASRGRMGTTRKRWSPPLPRGNNGMSRIAYAKALRRETITRRLRSGGMLRRYAPEMFNADVYGVDDNDNVKVGSRETIWDALNGPFAPTKPKRAPVDPGVLSKLLNQDDRAHQMADRRDHIRHLEDAAALAGRDPFAAAYTYLPANHRTKPFGYGRLVARARLQQSLDVGPFEKSARTFNHFAANPLAAFKGLDHSPLPYTPRLPFAESDAAFQGRRPNKLQQFEDFVPPPEMPKLAPPPEGGGAAPAAGGDAPATEF